MNSALAVRTAGTKPPAEHTDVAADCSACVSYVIWIYSMSHGPFGKYDLPSMA